MLLALVLVAFPEALLVMVPVALPDTDCEPENELVRFALPLCEVTVERTEVLDSGAEESVDGAEESVDGTAEDGVTEEKTVDDATGRELDWGLEADALSVADAVLRTLLSLAASAEESTASNG